MVSHCSAKPSTATPTRYALLVRVSVRGGEPTTTTTTQAGDFWRVLGESLSDYVITCGTRLIANSLAEQSSQPVYRYLYSHAPDQGYDR